MKDGSRFLPPPLAPLVDDVGCFLALLRAGHPRAGRRRVKKKTVSHSPTLFLSLFLFFFFSSSSLVSIFRLCLSFFSSSDCVLYSSSLLIPYHDISRTTPTARSPQVSIPCDLMASSLVLRALSLLSPGWLIQEKETLPIQPNQDHHRLSRLDSGLSTHRTWTHQTSSPLSGSGCLRTKETYTLSLALSLTLSLSLSHTLTLSLVRSFFFSVL